MTWCSRHHVVLLTLAAILFHWDTCAALCTHTMTCTDGSAWCFDCVHKSPRDFCKYQRSLDSLPAPHANTTGALTTDTTQAFTCTTDTGSIWDVFAGVFTGAFTRDRLQEFLQDVLDKAAVIHENIPKVFTATYPATKLGCMVRHSHTSEGEINVDDGGITIDVGFDSVLPWYTEPIKKYTVFCQVGNGRVPSATIPMYHAKVTLSGLSLLEIIVITFLAVDVVGIIVVAVVCKRKKKKKKQQAQTAAPLAQADSERSITVLELTEFTMSQSDVQLQETTQSQSNVRSRSPAPQANTRSTSMAPMPRPSPQASMSLQPGTKHSVAPVEMSRQASVNPSRLASIKPTRQASVNPSAVSLHAGIDSRASTPQPKPGAKSRSTTSMA